jgi:pilus assembly protein Flp/PilA
MTKFSASVRRFWRGEEGATLVEYGLLVGLLSIVAIASIVLVGKFVNGAFDQVQTEMSASGINSKAN